MQVPSTSRCQDVEASGGLEGPLFLSLAQAVRTGVLVLSESGELRFANDAARRLLALEVLNSLAERPVPLERVFPREWVEALKEGEVEVEVDTESGRRMLLLRTMAVRETRARLILVEDRTNVAAHERTLAIANRSRTERLLRPLVHDLRAPLNAIALNLEVLHEELVDGEARRTTEILRQEVARLGRALEFFARKALREDRPRRAVRRVDLRRIVREVARLVRPVARQASIRMRVDVPDVAALARLERDALVQALLNLVVNALEAQPDGGELLLNVRGGERDHLIRIEDRGPGIPDELRERVFEMNFTTRDDGSGIGLPVAHSLVDSLGGELRLGASSPAGTTVEVSIPALTEGG